MYPRIVLSSFAAIAIALAGAVSAGTADVDGGAVSAGTADVDGNDVSSTVKDPVPNAEAQAKTEKMLKEEKGAVEGN